jgi:transcriptional regulator with XRE-family HTH domain
MRAARALLGIDQKTLAELAGVSLPTIQRMEASTGNVRGVVETLMRVVETFDRAGVELIGRAGPQRQRRTRRSVEGAGAATSGGGMILRGSCSGAV